MISFLHNYTPDPILLSFGPISLYWYGLLIATGIVSAIYIALWLGKKYLNINSDIIIDLSFWLIITGLIGARIYDVFLMFPYYLENPVQIVQIWKGGMAIHGSIIAGLITIYFFAKKRKIGFFKLSALIAPGLALGQAIGRFGNYFNQEIFGLPTSLPWGIPIEAVNRPIEYIDEVYFHPTFLYESLGCLLIFILLISLFKLASKKNWLGNYFYVWMTMLYMILYSILRFSLEFIRLDETPLFLGLRWPQIISLFIIIASILIIIFYRHVQNEKEVK